MNFLKKYYGALLLIFLLIFSAVAHGYNMFHFPAYFDDEGTYMSQAWSILSLGKLAPYTYWYDHAPFGSILIAIWVWITGGFFTFGMSINSGRVFMLIIQLLNVALLYKIGIKIGNKFTSVLTVLLFSLSPLAITLHRMVFLDNIMVFLLLLSLYLLLKNPFRISYAILSAVSLGLCTLTKESGLFFIPPLFAILVFQSHKKNRHFTLVKWVVVLIGTLSFYLLFALLKGELFSPNLFNASPHVSLIDTFLWQTSRHGGFFLNKSSEFYYTFIQSWLYTDKLLIIGGIATTVVNIIIGIKKRNYLIASLPSLFYSIYLIRGGIINDQYLIPILPFFSLNIALFLSGIFSIFKNKFTSIKYLLFFLTIAGITFYYAQNLGLYFLDHTKNQLETISWLKKNTTGKLSVGDGYALVDMWYGNTKDVYTFKGYQHYWKIEDDPEVVSKLLPDSWRSMSYLIITPRMARDFEVNVFPKLKTFLKQARLVKTIDYEQKNIINKNILISASGPIKIYQRQTEEEIILNASWNYYKGTFIKSYGQSIDPNRQYKTTSEGQSYAMLRAVFENDKPTFDGVWTWTKDHLQYRSQDKLISWLWGEKNGKEQLIDSANATDADEDIALSLVLASHKWNNAGYLAEARVLINDIWKKCIVKVNGRYYLIAGAGFKETDGNVINPSYLSPATYKIFSTIDTKHPWQKLADDSYFILNQINKLKSNKNKLPTNWILLTANGNLASSKKYTGNDSDNYGFDAFRVMWRVSLDSTWFNDPQAKSYLKNSAEFFKSQEKFYSVYSQDGKPTVNYTSISTDVGPLANLSVTNTGETKKIYQELFLDKFNFNGGYWGDKNNYYDQNWAWFGTALYTKSIILPTQILSDYEK